MKSKTQKRKEAAERAKNYKFYRSKASRTGSMTEEKWHEKRQAHIKFLEGEE